jgi:HAD superfamily hydrolase (TIGR01509 family)
MSATRQIRAVIFDFDGVIADTELLHYATLRDTLAPEGIGISEKAYWETYVVLDDRDSIKTAYDSVGRSLDDAKLRELMARKEARFDAEVRKGVRLFPGVADAIRALAASVPLAIASGALSSEIRAILASHGLGDAFVGIVGADNVTNGKPHPETYLRAFDLLRNVVVDLNESECLVIEDTVNGVKGAKSAGMPVLAVTNTTSGDRLQHADVVVTSLEGLVPSSFPSPFTVA